MDASSNSQYGTQVSKKSTNVKSKLDKSKTAIDTNKKKHNRRHRTARTTKNRAKQAVARMQRIASAAVQVSPPSHSSHAKPGSIVPRSPVICALPCCMRNRNTWNSVKQLEKVEHIAAHMKLGMPKLDAVFRFAPKIRHHSIWPVSARQKSSKQHVQRRKHVRSRRGNMRSALT